MFDQPTQPDPSGTRNWLSNLLAWSGILLLFIGGVLAGPHLAPFLNSRTHPLPQPTPPLSPPSPSPPTATPTLPPLLPFSDEEDGVLRLAPTATPSRPSGSPATPTPTPVGYPPTRIVIPAIDLDAPVVVTTWEVVNIGGVEQAIWVVPPMRAAGWHEGSAALGVPGNTVLNGHNTTNGEVFRDLYLLEPGDQVIVYSDDTPFFYQVSEVLTLPEGGQPLEVRMENARYIQPTDDERVTLVTCHPYGSLRYRLVVIARPVEPPSGDQAEGGSNPIWTPYRSPVR